MYKHINNHMKRVRGITLEAINTIPEDLADHIPNTYRNNIRWNFGHILVVQEKLVFGVMNKNTQLPSGYLEYFNAGTNPMEWQSIPPSFKELEEELTKQLKRIESYIPLHVNDPLPQTFTNSRQMQFHTFAETLLFSFYHEALHMESIKKIYSLVK